MSNLKNRLLYLIILNVLLVNLACNKKQSIVHHSVMIFLNDGKIQEDEKVDCDLVIMDSMHTYSLQAGIEYRGSSSKFFPKRSYTVKFKNKQAKIWQGIDLMGDWVLYAPYADRTCIRNTLAQYFYRAMGHYSTISIFVDLYINNEYLGLYELRDKIGLDKNGLIDTKAIFKIDKTTGKKKQKLPSLISPSVDIQEHDLAKGVSFEDAFTSVTKFENTLLDSTSDLSKFVEESSFIDYFLFSEFANSPDAYRSSCYFKVLKDNRLAMGPVWDYDLAFGNSTLYNGEATQGWRFLLSETIGPYYTPAPKWWSKLYAKPSFKKAMYKRWTQLRLNLFADEHIQLMVDSFSNNIKPALVNNFNKWPVIGKQIQWASSPKPSYVAELDYLKKWMLERAKWMDIALKQ